MNSRQRRTKKSLSPKAAAIAGGEGLAAALEIHMAGRLDEAEHAYCRILNQDPRNAHCLNLLGVIANQRRRPDMAVPLIERAIAINGQFAPYHSELGVALQALGRLEEAVAAYRHALALAPDTVEAHSNLGSVLHIMGRYDQAAACFGRALALRPDLVDAHNNLGNTLLHLGALDEAVASFHRAIALKPDYAEAHFNLANVFLAQRRLEPAIACCRRAIDLNPNLAEAHVTMGNALTEQERADEAAAAFRRAIELNPDSVEALINLGVDLAQRGQFEPSLACHRRALAIKPDHPLALTYLVGTLQSLCQWDEELTAGQRRLGELVRSGGGEIHPFAILAQPSSGEEQLICATTSATRIEMPVAARLAPIAPRSGGRIKLGYLSGDFRNHAVAYLMAELIERHDRDRFEVFAYSFGPDDDSPMRNRLSRSFDRFTDMGLLSDAAAAAAIHRDGIDILVDLSGYTKGSRPRILAFRPAPVQVNFLGYPGTMGASFIDYIIADHFCIPAGQDGLFRENVVRLPDCYQPNDTQREIAEPPPTRADCGLPDQGFVFCSFNNAYKLTENFFQVWMRLLQSIPGSVLWLLENNASTTNNLLRQAAVHNIAPDRLVFAPKKPLSEHLARHQQADLFLDTLPYNAHTTASDALWAGLPVLTCAGPTFAGRVAGSLLTAVGLPELITDNIADYEALALHLATHPEELATIGAKLRRNRTTAPLFDIQRYTRNLEEAFSRMWEMFCSGRIPAPIDI